MNTITKENIEKFKSYGFSLTPVIKSTDPEDDKTPYLKNFKWAYDWTAEDLLGAERIGAFHGGKFYAVDPDDKNFVAHKFMSLLPPTFEVGKPVNGRIINTQRIYKIPDGQTARQYGYPKKAGKGDKIIEVLVNKQSIIAGVDRVILNNVEPLVIDPSSMTLYARLIATFTELYNNWETKGTGRRDETYLALAGALAHTDIPLDLKEKFVERLCVLTDDPEIRNRVNKCKAQEEAIKENPDKVYSIKGLSDRLGVNLPAFDEIKRKEDKETNYEITFPLIDGSTLLNTKYTKPTWLLEPLIREKSITQISGGYGAGKTQLGLAVALAVCHGRDFLEYKIRKDNPILYVEAELCGSDIQERIVSLNNPYLEINKICKNTLNSKYQYTLSQDDLINAGIKYGFPDLAVADDETRAAVGRKAIEDLTNRIKNKTGKFPILFLDNISALTSIDENKAKDWSSFMRWLIKLKSKGVSSVIFHHINKSTGSASGSNMSQRLIDTHLILKRLDENQRFEISGKSVQCSVHFDKFRNFGGDQVKPFMLTCNDEGIWKKYPMLDQTNVKIVGYYNQNVSVKEMCEAEEDWNEKTIYKRVKKLKEDGIINETKKQSSY